ncbi:MAG: transposase [Armatimonadota bacterium]
MPRTARIVLPDVPHHLTQRGNNRQTVFFHDADYLHYLALLREETTKHQVVVHGYSLMSNHTHLALTPPDEEALARAIGRTHYRYTLYFNRVYQRSGHLWQNRFFSCALDNEHYWTALHYIERNSVRAQLVECAMEYRWSSAAAHVGGDDASGLLDLPAWCAVMPAEQWRERLVAPEEDALLLRLRTTTHTGRPLGAASFVAEYEAALGRRLLALPVGRPKKAPTDAENR